MNVAGRVWGASAGYLLCDAAGVSRRTNWRGPNSHRTAFVAGAQLNPAGLNASPQTGFDGLRKVTINSCGDVSTPGLFNGDLRD
jgi:hypothetical protein